jgi:hypothetical protein
MNVYARTLYSGAGRPAKMAAISTAISVGSIPGGVTKNLEYAMVFALSPAPKTH